MKREFFSKLILISILVTGVSCQKDDLPESIPSSKPKLETRSFSMGFTPWLYEASLEAQDEIYSFIDNNADIVAHHLDGGVPWSESVQPNNFNNYGTDVKNEINGRVNRMSTISAKEVYLAVSPFNSLRTGKALYWNTATGQAIPSPYDTLGFENNFIISSYANYVDELIKKLNPTIVNYAIEANEYWHNVPSDRINFQTFAINVYTILKNKYPNIKFMISFAMSDPGSSKMVDSASMFVSLKDYIDIVGISIYPYAFYSHADKGDPANLPSDWLSQIQQVAPGKPLFIAETGFIGEALSIPGIPLVVDSDEDKQAAYIEVMCSEANSLKIEGIIWFTAYDFDTLWNDLLGDDLSAIWRDTGLKDGDQNPRKSLYTWQNWYKKSKAK